MGGNFGADDAVRGQQGLPAPGGSFYSGGLLDMTRNQTMMEMKMAWLLNSELPVLGAATHLGMATIVMALQRIMLVAIRHIITCSHRWWSTCSGVPVRR